MHEQKYSEELLTLGQNIFDISGKDFEAGTQSLQFINGMLNDPNIRKKIPEIVKLSQTHKGNQNAFMGAIMGEMMMG